MNLTQPESVDSVRRIAMMPHLILPHHRLFGIMAETIEIHSNHKPVLEIAATALGRFPVSDSQSDPPLRLDIVVDENGYHDLPPGNFPPPHFFHLQGWLSIQAGSLGFAIADLTAGRAFVVIAPALLACEAYIRYHFVEALSLAMLGLARQYFVLHAACLEKNGKGIVILAESGMGKSSLAYSCLRRGYSLITEDSLQIKVLPDGSYSIYGMPWKLHLLPDACQLFPELSGTVEKVQINGEWKLEVDVDVHFPGLTRTSTHPVALVFLERFNKNHQKSSSGAFTRLSALSQVIARQRLEVIWTWDIGWSESHEQAIRNLLKLPAYCLAMNGSPDEASAALDELLCK